jgi:hypothetical protein
MMSRRPSWVWKATRIRSEATQVFGVQYTPYTLGQGYNLVGFFFFQKEKRLGKKKRRWAGRKRIAGPSKQGLGGDYVYINLYWEDLASAAFVSLSAE